jgi:hypothetical protein
MSAYSLVVVCEADADRRLATGLGDRVLCEEVEWLDIESLDLHRRWQGLREGSSYLKWHQVNTLAKQRGLRIKGRFEDGLGAPDARAARLALQLLATSGRQPDAVVLIRDSDGQEERRIGLEQARSSGSWPFPIAIGLAHLSRESWVLAGFEPQNEAEQERLAGLREELGFDPRFRSESLRGKPGEPRHAKLVLERLTGKDHEREELCWTGCSLEILRSRGTTLGLAEYLDEVRERIVPIFGVTPP